MPHPYTVLLRAASHLGERMCAGQISKGDFADAAALLNNRLSDPHHGAGERFIDSASEAAASLMNCRTPGRTSGFR
jgi:hypothetical protein